METKASVEKNYIYNLLYQVLVILTPLVTTPYVTRVLGDEMLGACDWTQSMCTYFLLITSLGISLYGQREIAYHRDSLPERSRVFAELFTMRAAVVLLGLLLYNLWLCRGPYTLLFRIQNLELIAVIFEISWVLQGMENFRAVVGRNTLVKLLSVACIFLFVKKPADIGIYILCQSGAVLVGNLSLWYYLPRYVDRKSIDTIRVLRHLRPVLILFIPQIAIQVYAVMDRTMLGYLANTMAQNGYYSQAQKIVKVALAVVTSMGTVMLPRASYLFSNHETERMKAAIMETFRFALFMGTALMFGVIGIAGNLVPWFFAPEFAPVEMLLYMLAPRIFLVALSNVSGIQCLVPMKRQFAFNLSVILGAVCNLILNFMLIPKLGAVGACIGTVAAELVVTASQFYSLRDMLAFGKIGRMGLRNLAAGACMGAVVFAAGRGLPPMIGSTVLLVMLGVAVYTVALLLLRDDYPKVLLAKGRAMLGKKHGSGV